MQRIASTDPGHVRSTLVHPISRADRTIRSGPPLLVGMACYPMADERIHPTHIGWAWVGEIGQHRLALPVACPMRHRIAAHMSQRRRPKTTAGELG